MKKLLIVIILSLQFDMQAAEGLDPLNEIDYNLDDLGILAAQLPPSPGELARASEEGAESRELPELSVEEWLALLPEPTVRGDASGGHTPATPGLVPVIEPAPLSAAADFPPEAIPVLVTPVDESLALLDLDNIPEPNELTALLEEFAHEQQMAALVGYSEPKLPAAGIASGAAVVVSSPAETNPFKCRFCDYTATRKHAVENHERRHTGERPFKCRFCSYATTRKDTLTKHERRHTGERPYQCTLCNFRANQKSILNKHMYKHTGEKPFRCDECPYACRDKTQLRKHKEHHLDFYPYRCDQCTYGDSTPKLLEKHKKEIHDGAN